MTTKQLKSLAHRSHLDFNRVLREFWNITPKQNWRESPKKPQNRKKFFDEIVRHMKTEYLVFDLENGPVNMAEGSEYDDDYVEAVRKEVEKRMIEEIVLSDEQPSQAAIDMGYYIT